MAANGGTIYARGATPGGPVHAIWQNFERRVWCDAVAAAAAARAPLGLSPRRCIAAAQVATQPISTIPAAAAAQDQEGRDARRPAH